MVNVSTLVLDRLVFSTANEPPKYCAINGENNYKNNSQTIFHKQFRDDDLEDAVAGR